MYVQYSHYFQHFELASILSFLFSLCSVMILLCFFHASAIGINLCSISSLSHVGDMLHNTSFVDCFSCDLFSICYCLLLVLFNLYIYSHILPCLNLEVGMG